MKVQDALDEAWRRYHSCYDKADAVLAGGGNASDPDWKHWSSMGDIWWNRMGYLEALLAEGIEEVP